MELRTYKLDWALRFYAALNGKQLSTACSLPAEVYRVIPSEDTSLCPGCWATRAQNDHCNLVTGTWRVCSFAFLWLPLILAALSDPLASPKVPEKKLKNGSYQVKKKGRILLHVFLSYVYVPSGNCSLSGFAASTAKDCHTTCKGGAFLQPGLTLRSEFSSLESELICFRWKPKCQPACKQYRWQVTER